MVDRAVMERRLRALQGFLDGLRRRFAGMSLEAFVRDEDARLIAERLLHLACEACIDMANHVLADRGAEQPETYRQTFELVGRLGLVPPELTATLQRMATMRNILVHGYLAVDPAKVHDVAVHRLQDLEQFATCMARLL
jgi:uncharacterized protein YutE (UPF0331/DUF86 family)